MKAMNFVLWTTNVSPLDRARRAAGGGLPGNIFLFAGETRTVPGSPLHPASGTSIDGYLIPGFLASTLTSLFLHIVTSSTSYALNAYK